MLYFDFVNNPYIVRKINSFDLLRQEIPKVLINNFDELRLQKFSIFSSVYYSLVLSGYDVHASDVELLLYGKSAISMNKDKAVAYRNCKKILDYTHEYYLKSNAVIDKQFICNFHMVMNQGLTECREIGIYRNDIYKTSYGYVGAKHDQISMYMDQLIAYMNQEDNIHPVIKASIIYTNFMKIAPFENNNGRVARCLILLFLYRHGCSLQGFLSYEKYFAAGRGKKHSILLAKSLGSTFDDVLDNTVFIEFFADVCMKAAVKTLRYVKNPALLDVDETADQLSQRQRDVLAYIKKSGKISLSEYVVHIDPDSSRATRDFDKLREYGYLQKKGLGKSTYYILRKNLL